MKTLCLVGFMALVLASTSLAGEPPLCEWNRKECVKVYVKRSKDKRMVDDALTSKDDKTNIKDEKTVPPALIGAGIAAATTLFKQGIVIFKEKMAEKEKEYIGEYDIQVAGANPFPVDGQGISSIEITRYASHGDYPKDRSSEETSFISLDIWRHKSGAFALTINKIRVRYAKCKIGKEELKKKPKIDLTLMLGLQCFWLDANGMPHNDTIGSVILGMKDVPVIGTQKEKPIESYPPLCGETVRRTPKEYAEAPVPIKAWLPPLPVNHNVGSQPENVAFILTVRVTEYDDYARTAKKYGKDLSLAADALQSGLIKFLESFPQ